MGFVVDFFKPKKAKQFSGAIQQVLQKDSGGSSPKVGARGDLPSAEVRDELSRNRRRRTRSLLTGPGGVGGAAQTTKKTLLGT